jgi:hypothetical protein
MAEQTLRTEISTAQASLKKSENELKKTAKERDTARSEAETYKSETDRLTLAAQTQKQHYETEIAKFKGKAGALERDKSDLAQQVEGRRQLRPLLDCSPLTMRNGVAVVVWPTTRTSLVLETRTRGAGRGWTLMVIRSTRMIFTVPISVTRLITRRSDLKLGTGVHWRPCLMSTLGKTLRPGLSSWKKNWRG